MGFIYSVLLGLQEQLGELVPQQELMKELRRMTVLEHIGLEDLGILLRRLDDENLITNESYNSGVLAYN